METDTSAPPVVVVVVTSDPGPWFHETLRSLARQDYPNLSVLVIDAASVEDPSPLVAEALPEAFVRRLEHRVGFATAANDVLSVVEGASHFLFCHDDVALAPDVVTVMVEEAFRSNAGVVAPKLVDWERPEVLQSIGAGADRFGVVHPLVERGELDQEQHDGVRDVFVAPGGATLVRADLFAALGGFAPDIPDCGEDLDLSWRVQVAGARVVVAPAARVRHLEATAAGIRAGTGSAEAGRRRQGRAERHRVLTLLTCSSLLRLLWVLPQVAVNTAVEALWQVLRGRPGAAAGVLTAATGALRAPGRTWRARRALQRHRRSPDRELAQLQSRGNARLRAFLRSRVDRSDSTLPATVVVDGAGAPAVIAPPAGAPTAGAPAVAVPVGAPAVAVPVGAPAVGASTVAVPVGAPAVGASTVAVAEVGAPAVGAEAVEPGVAAEGGLDAAGGAIGRTGRRVPQLGLAAVAAVAILLVVGSRSLLAGSLPAVGSLPVGAASLFGWWHGWWSTWRNVGLGSPGPGAPGLGLLGLLGTASLGAVGTLGRILVLGPLVLGPLGAYRAARWWGSRRASAAALVVYATIPVPYDALAGGRWPGLVACAAAPWVLVGICRLSAARPFPSVAGRSPVGRVVGLGLLVAVVASVAPAFLFVVVLVGVAMAAGSLLTAAPAVALRCAGVAAGASVVGVVLLAPWSASVLSSRAATFGPDPGPGARLGLGELLHWHTGPVGDGVLGWGLLAAAALPLLVGGSWRLAWAARLWVVALACVLATWAGLRGWIPVPDPEIVLAPAAAALAGAVSLGVVAFELDLPGYRFGWRQAASTVAALAAVVAAVPVVQAVGSGRWGLPTADAGSVLGVSLPDTGRGDYRVLWVGAPAALPLRSFPLAPGLAYATSSDGLPGTTDQWPAHPDPAALAALATNLRLTSGRLTTQLGHLLAPLSVRYLVVPNHLGPVGSGAPAVAAPDRLLAGLGQQTDLQSVTVDANYTVYANASWTPVRSLLSPTASLPTAAAGDDALVRGLQRLDLRGSDPVLPGPADAVVGRLATAGRLYVASNPSSGWTLRLGGVALPGARALGAGEVFTLPGHGPPSQRATLRAPTSRADRAGQVVEVLLVALAVAVVALERRRRAREPDTVRAEWFAPVAPVGRTGAGRPGVGGPGAVGVSPATIDDEDVWVDG